MKKHPYPTQNKAAFSHIILLIKNVYYGGLQQKNCENTCKRKNACFYTWIMAISVSYFQSDTENKACKHPKIDPGGK